MTLQAQSDTSSFQYDSIVVITASRQAGKLASTPATVSVLNAADLNRLSPRSLPEGLMQVPGIWMQKTNHGGGSAFVRGLTGNQTLLLIDGIRLNNSTYRYGPNQYLNTIDPFSLQGVEVLRGGGSVQYGSDALGGVIQLLSKTPEFNDEGWDLGGTFTAKALSADMEQSLRLEVDLSGSRVAIHTGLSYKNFGDLLAGGDLGVQAPSGYQERDADFKARIQLSKRQELTLAWQTVRQENVGRYDQVAQRGYALYEFDPQVRSLAYARLKWQLNQPWLQRIQFTISGQRSLEVRTKRKEQEDFITRETDEIDTRGLSLEIFSKPTRHWSIVSGIEYYGDVIHSETRRLSLPDTITGPPLRGLYPDQATAGNLGLFSLHRWQKDRLTLEGGLRYNVFLLDLYDPVFGEQSLQPQALVGNTGISYALASQTRAFFSANTGFRAPNVNDLSSFGSFDSGIEVPVASLDPERSYSLEAGYRWQGESLRFSVLVYQTWLSNLISRVRSQYLGQDSLNGEAVYAKTNLSRAYIQGLETEMQWQISRRLDLETYVIYTFGQDDTGQPLRRIPPLFGTMQLSYRKNAWFARLQYQFAGTQDRLSSGDIDDHRIPEGGTPGWQILNAYLGYAFKWLDLNLGLQNLTNEAYRMHGSGVDGYGRSAWLALQVHF